MTEPVSSSIGAGVAWKMAGLGAIFSAGVMGACVIAAVDPPANKRELFCRAFVAGVGSLFCGPVVVRILDHYVDWVDLTKLPTMEAIEWAAPVYLVVGTLSWGAFGALAALSRILKQRGATVVATRIGIGRPKARSTKRG